MTEPPDLVIAGAAKSGTTALYTYLAQHPGVFMPRLKEPDFFSTDLPGGISTLDEYRALFAAAPPHCLTGEASTEYLYSKVAIARAVAHNPKMKFIFMLRNPVDAAVSLHGYAYRYGREPHSDFEYAWRAQEIRFAKQRKTQPELNNRIFEYDYRETYRYAEQVRRVPNDRFLHYESAAVDLDTLK
jgi:hypothetical protein